MKKARKRRPSPVTLELRFSGGGVSPTTVSAGELAELLTALESSVAGVLGVDPRQAAPVLSLVSIKDASEGLVFASSVKGGPAAFRTMATAVKKGDISGLPAITREGAKKMLQFVRRRQCTAEMTERREGRGKPIATLTPKTELIERPDAIIRGETVLYGVVVRVGGDEPKIRLRYADDAPPLSCSANETLAKEVGKHLYSVVGLSGHAEWNPRDKTLLSFQATKLLPYEGGSVASGLDELSDAIGEYWSDVENVNEEITKIRDL